MVIITPMKKTNVPPPVKAKDVIAEAQAKAKEEAAIALDKTFAHLGAHPPAHLPPLRGLGSTPACIRRRRYVAAAGR